MSIGVMTRSRLCSAAAERWLALQVRNPNMPYAEALAIWRELDELGVDPKREDVDRIIGNGSWTQLMCDTCLKDVETVFQFKSAVMNDGRTVNICPECIEKAQSLLESTK